MARELFNEALEDESDRGEAISRVSTLSVVESKKSDQILEAFQ
jgi:hypothetical protein